MVSRKCGVMLVAWMAMTVAFGCESSPRHATSCNKWSPQETYLVPYGPGDQRPPYGPSIISHWLQVTSSPANAMQEASPSNPDSPAPQNLVLSPPGAPAAHHACVISESAQTWKGSVKCSKASGQCKRSASGELTIQRTGPKSATISTSGYTDSGASFDPATCSVSHAHWAPKAPIAISLSYAFVVSPKGRLSGSLAATVDNSVFGCTGSYSLSGTRE